MPETETVRTEISNGTCTLRFENPDKRNALTPSMIRDVIDAIDEAERRDGVTVLVITGAGEKAFCSGYDVSKFEDAGDEGPELFDEMIEKIYDYEYPTIARINGHVFGGAVEVISVCDIRISVPEVLFGVPAAKLGIVWRPTGINHLSKLVGSDHASKLLFTGEPIEAAEADHIGLVTQLVEPDRLSAKVDEMAASIATNAPLSLKGMKRILRSFESKRELTPTETAFAETLRSEAKNSRDHREGIEAFSEDREPEFVGE